MHIKTKFLKCISAVALLAVCLHAPAADPKITWKFDDEMNKKGLHASIETDRLFMRGASQQDLNDFMNLYQDGDNLKFLNAGVKLSPGAIQQKLKVACERWLNNDVRGLISIFVKEGEKLTFIGVWGLQQASFAGGGEWSILLDKGYWKKGYGSEVASVLKPWAFDVVTKDYKFLNKKLDTVYATASPENVASVLLLEKMGFGPFDTKSEPIEENSVFSNDSSALKDSYNILTKDKNGVERIRTVIVKDCGGVKVKKWAFCVKVGDLLEVKTVSKDVKEVKDIKEEEINKKEDRPMGGCRWI